jgi:hypothetical protein
MGGKTATATPEHAMVRKALLASAVVLPVAYGVGLAADGRGAGFSAAIAVAILALNFAAHGWSLAWAARISVTVLQIVALAGFVVRIGIVVALLFALDRLDFFSPLVFLLTVVAGTISLLVYEARLVARGLGGQLEIPPHPVMVRAAAKLAEREAR